MKTIRLYKFKDSISQKKPLFKEDFSLNTLNDLMQINNMDVEVVTEYVIDISNDVNCDNLATSKLLSLCASARHTIEHYFMTTINTIDYDLI